MDGFKLGNEYLVLRVDATLAKSGKLIQLLTKVKIIGHEARLIITCP